MDPAATVLFGRTRQKVLTLLFEYPDESFYLREISRLAGISPGALQAELRKLHRADLITRTRDGNRVSYRANSTHPVFDSLRDVVRKTCGIPTQIKAALLPLADEIVFAGIYGSLARGRSHGRSDVDVLIVGSLPVDRALAALVPLEDRLGREISIRVFPLAEFRERLERGDPFLRGVVSGPITPVHGSVDDAR